MHNPNSKRFGVRVLADRLAILSAGFNRSANRLLLADQGKEWCKLQMAVSPASD